MKIVLRKQGLKSNIGRAISDRFASKLKERSEKIAQTVRQIIIRHFLASPTYRSLTDFDGILRAEFGLTNGEAGRVQDIVSNFDIVHTKPPKIRVNDSVGFNFRVSFNISSTDYSDIDVSNGAFVTENDDLIPWLHWLLFAGVEVVVSDYSVKFLQGAGRSGNAVMIKRISGKSYSVNPTYAGTLSSNWITRTLNDARPDIIEELRTIFNEFS